MKQILLILALLVGLNQAAHAQQQIPKDTKLENWRANYYSKTDKILKAIFSGKDATAISGEVFVTQFEMRTFRNGDTNQLQFVAMTPECFFNPVTHTSYSTNTIKAFDAGTNIYIEGRGFYCAETNGVLIVSNNVETQFQKKSLKAQNLNALPTSARGSKNDIVKIFSDHFQFLYTSNLVSYSGNVRVVDPQMQMNCDLLTGYFNTNRFRTNAGIEQITAEGNVVILTPYQGRATGTKAIYKAGDNTETVELTGNAFWSNGQDEIQAARFLFDRPRNLVHADGAVRIKLANATLTRTNATHRPLLGSHRSRLSTNGYTELFAEHVTVQLSPTNAPPLSFLAEENVVITNQVECVRATGQKALYTTANQQIELSGQPALVSTNGELRGKLITLTGLSNPVLKSTGDARLRIVVDSASTRKTIKSPSKRGAITNGILEVVADTLEYRTNLLTFTKDVHAEALEGTNLQATLDCQLLTIEFANSNRIRSINARTQVYARQAPTPTIAKRSVQCNSMTLNFWPDSSFFKSALLEGDVKAEQIGPAPRKARIEANMITALFTTTSNILERAEAENKVYGEQDEGGGKFTQFSGGRVKYNRQDTNAPVEITDSPIVWYWMDKESIQKASPGSDVKAPSGIKVFNADSLFCNPVTKVFRATGPYVAIDIPPRTNTVDTTSTETAPINEPASPTE